MQQSLFGAPALRKSEFAVYHDESGMDRSKDRFLLQGALFVPIRKWKSFLDHLMSARDGYSGRVHFSDLRDKTSSKKGSVASKWLDLYFASISSDCPYKCMLADTYSKHNQITRFTKDFQLYNYATVLAIHGGISWSLIDYERISLTIYSEETSRSPDDNFTTYVPSQIHLRVNRRRRPHSRAPLLDSQPPRVKLIPGDPAKATKEDFGHCQFVQLTDLITGAVNEAINSRAIQQIKIDLGKLVASWIQDTRLPPWVQSQALHRQFSISCFPDSSGGFYDVPLTIATKNQLRLETDY